MLPDRAVVARRRETRVMPENLGFPPQVAVSSAAGSSANMTGEVLLAVHLDNELIDEDDEDNDGNDDYDDDEGDDDS